MKKPISDIRKIEPCAARVFILYFRDRTEVVLTVSEDDPKLIEMTKRMRNPLTRPKGVVEAIPVSMLGDDGGEGVISRAREVYFDQEKRNLIGSIERMWPQ